MNALLLVRVCVAMLNILCQRIAFAMLMLCGVQAMHVDFFDASYNSKIMKTLEYAPIVSTTPMQEHMQQEGKRCFATYPVHFVTLGTKEGLEAIFKETPNYNDVIAEAAAYKLSNELGFFRVPPTVIRQIDGKWGIMQLFVDTPINLLDGHFQTHLKYFSLEEWSNFLIFNFVFGKWDFGASNMMSVKDHHGFCHPIAIDNTCIRNQQHVESYGKLPFVRINKDPRFDGINDECKQFPFERCIDIERPEEFLERFEVEAPKCVETKLKAEKKLRLVIYKGAIWQQFQAFNPKFIRPFGNYLSIKTCDALRSLNLETLRNIFLSQDRFKLLNPLDEKIEIAHNWFTDEFLTEQYLKRRDLFLQYYDGLIPQRETGI